MGWVQNKKQIRGLVHACFECFFIIVFFSLGCGFFPQLSFYHQQPLLLLGTARAAGTRAQSRGCIITHSFILYHGRLSTTSLEEGGTRDRAWGRGFGCFELGLKNFAGWWVRAWISGRQLLG